MAEGKTTVVNIKSGEPYDIYIGRANGRYKLPQSKWANPFVLRRESERETVIEQYREWLMNQPELISSLHELKGKRLACWCKPKGCHGDVLAELADAKP